MPECLIINRQTDRQDKSVYLSYLFTYRIDNRTAGGGAFLQGLDARQEGAVFRRSFCVQAKSNAVSEIFCPDCACTEEGQNISETMWRQPRLRRSVAESKCVALYGA